MTYLLARYWPHILGVLIYTAIVGLIGHAAGEWQGDRRAAKSELALSNAERDAAYQVAEAEAKARKVEQERAAAVAEAADAYEKGRADAQAKADRVVADLRAGTVRLRQHWQAAVATCDVSRDSAAALAAEREAELRAESAARIVRIGAEADAKVRALQDAYEALRRPAP